MNRLLPVKTLYTPLIYRVEWWCVALIMGLIMATPLSGQEASETKQPMRTIIVSGVGEVQASPDMAEINVGVTSEADSASDAVQQNTQLMQRLFDTLKTAGIDDKDIQTRSFDVSPRYQGNRRGEEPPKIVGYRVTNQVHIRVRQLKELGDILDRVVQAGANNINGIQFMIGDDSKLMDEARRKAVSNAKKKASVLSEAAGVELGRVTEIREGNGQPRPVGQPRMMMAEASSVPIASGEQTLTARVEIVYEIGSQ